MLNPASKSQCVCLHGWDVVGFCVYFLLVGLQNSDSTLGIIDSLEQSALTAGKFCLVAALSGGERQAKGE